MKKVFIYGLIAIMLISSLVGCSKKEAEASEIGNIVMTGSTTLAPVVTKATQDFINANKTWDKVNGDFSKEEIKISINGGGSGAGTKALIEGSANFGMVSRPVKDSEKEALGEYKEYKLGTDALTISVNPNNKVYEIQDSFTSEELKNIFSGEYKTWNDLDESLPKEDIVLVTRDIGGGAHGVFQKKIMGDTKVSDNVIQAPSMGALVSKIIENDNAIGYASFGVVNQNKEKLVPMSVDGVEPTKENIISGDYIISRPLLVISKNEVSPEEKSLIDYLLSDEGMKIVEDLGFVPEK